MLPNFLLCKAQPWHKDPGDPKCHSCLSSAVLVHTKNHSVQVLELTKAEAWLLSIKGTIVSKTMDSQGVCQV